MAARDYLEAVNYAFVDADLLAKWGLSDGAVPLANPLSAELGVMRTALLPGLVAALARNTVRQQPRVRLFELGNVFGAMAAKAPRETRASPPPSAATRPPSSGRRPPVRSASTTSRATWTAWPHWPAPTLEYRPSQPSWAHPGRSADVYRDGVCLGWIGQLHPRLQRALDLDVDVVAFELDLEAAVQPRRGQGRRRCPSTRPSAATSRSSSPNRCPGAPSRRPSVRRLRARSCAIWCCSTATRARVWNRVSKVLLWA